MKRVHHFEKHLDDEHLLLAIEGELSNSRTKEVAAHLAGCWDCRTRKQNFEKTIGNFVEARHAEFDAQVQPSAGLRALLKANLERIAAEPAKEKILVTAFRSTCVRRALVVAFATAAAIAIIVGGVERIRTQDSAVYAEGPLEPRPTLTPGAVRTVSTKEVCGANMEAHREPLVIPTSVKEEVFREYGMSAARPQYFEVDFLITPELGGANDIRNLWPEPYRAPVWNAHVKDQLEDKLRDMVCNGEIDLAIAQHDIAADWILAYKKYFHTNRPL
jgi:hypothetical protein